MKKLEEIFERWWSVYLIYFLLSFIFLADILVKNVLLYGSDWLLGAYTDKKWISNFIKTHGRIPLWNPYLRCGLPTVAAFFMDILTPLNLLRFIFEAHKVQVFGYIFYLSLGGLGMYLFAREWKLNPLPSFFAGLFYMFSGTIVTTIYGGHLGRSVSACMFPFMLFFLTRGINRNNILPFLIAGGFGGLAFLQGHFQLTYFAFLISVFYFYFYLIGIKRADVHDILKFSIFAFLGVLISILMYSFYIFPVLENLKYAARGAERGYEYSTSWSLPPFEILNLLYPHFSGYLDNYWGPSFFRLHLEYMGVVPFILGIFCFIYFFKESKIKFLLIWLIVVFFYAIGGYTPVFKLFYYLIPGVKKFRAPSLIFYQINFIFAISSAIFIDRLKNLKEKDLEKLLVITAGILFLLALIFSIFKSGFINLFSGLIVGENITEKENALHSNYAFLIKDVWLGFLIFGIFTGMIYTKKLKKFREIFLLTFVPFFLFDVWRVEKDFRKYISPPEIYFAKDEVVKFLEKDKSIYRVFPLRYRRSDEGILMLYGIESIAGYVANPVKGYQELIGAGNSVMFIPKNLIQYPHLLNFLDVKYIIDIPLPEDITGYPENIKKQIEFWKEFYKNYKKEFIGTQYVIYSNPFNRGRIFVNGKWKIISEDEILQNLFLDKNLEYIYLPKERLKNVKIPSQKDSIDFSFNIKRYLGDEIEFEYYLSDSAICVISQNWHPNWQIKIDEEKIKSFPVDYTLLGFVAPQGHHKVHLKFDSVGHKFGLIFSLTGYGVFIFSLILNPFLSKKKRRIGFLV